MNRSSPYNLAHAVAAGVALVAIVFAQGVAAFWRMFLHGLAVPMTPKALLLNYCFTAALFGALILILWASTYFSQESRKRAGAVPDGGPAGARASAVWLAARWAPLLTAVAIGLNFLCAAGIEWMTDIQPSDQELVKCFSGECPWGIRIVLGTLVILEAPLLEEPLFRGILFRGLWSAMPHWAATAISGFLFALVHVNAASFLPLWFLGCAFAELYRRTGTILAPMTAHALFNAANLALLPFLPATS